MGYQAVIFDFDYTLGDSTEGIIESANYGLKAAGQEEAGREAIRKTIGLSLKEAYVALTGDGSEEKAALFDRCFKEKADQVMVQNSRLYPGVLALLGRLKQQGIRIGIVTTKFHYRIDAILEKCQGAAYIDSIVGGEDVSSPKPDPEGVLSLLGLWGLKGEEVLYVGDSVVDAKTAQAAGVAFAGVTTGTTAEEELRQYPCVGVYHDLGELVEGNL
ncbi:MAG: HAD-IA family hydrolase [Lachnospiraceae bacterium]|nr:HAD-IA family hydrolase [Lachnospiraceae bacterium]